MTAQAVVDRIRTTANPIAGTALRGWGPGTTTPTATASPTVTSTLTRTPTSTAIPMATATATPTQAAAPTRGACPSPRPPVKMTATATGSNSFGVTVQAGAGIVREIDFRELRNASMTVGSRRDASAPFVYRPSTYSSQLQFSVIRPNGDRPWTVSFVVTDDCGPWDTFVGGGPGNGPYGNPAP